MAKTDRFRKDHEGLLKMAGDLAAILDAENLKTNANSVCMQLAKMSGVLKIHLAAEDKALYPELLKSKDKLVKDTAQKFIAEMGDLKAVVETYLSKWMAASKVQENPQVFITETTGILKALKNRIDRENNELYNLADKQAA